MKRILSLLLTLLLLLSLCSCGVSGDNPQMAAPSQTVAESTEPLFWPPLPTETEQTEPIETTAATEATEPVQRPSTGGKPTVTQKPSGDTDATYIPREDEEQPGGFRDEQEPAESTPEDLPDDRPSDNQQPDSEQPDEQQPDDQPEETLPPQTDPPQTQPTQPTTPKPDTGKTLDINGHYNSKEDVALYIHLYGKLPGNFYTKSQAERLFGWVDGKGHPLDRYAPGMSIGGDRFYNREGKLPSGTYYECDIGTVGASSRGSRRIVFKKDGTVYYTANHYSSFTQLYGPR